MHFSIPDTEEIKEDNGSFIVYNLHVNGIFHCSVRYRQLHELHIQLCKEIGGANLPSFPPKKFLTLNPSQVEERRLHLEKYVLQLSQNPRVLSNDIFNVWLVWGQKETHQITYSDEVMLDVYLMNGQKVCLRTPPALQTVDVVERVCKYLNLPSHLVCYFTLFFMAKDDGLTVVKKLFDFESPYISQKCSPVPVRITLRKSYWDQADDEVVAVDKVGLNLIYIQTVSEIEKGWILAGKEILRQLSVLQARGAKLEYIRLAQTLKYYGYTQFTPCFCDFPDPNTPVSIAAGNKELNFRIHSKDGSIKEGNFKVTRIKCWRISSIRESAADPINTDFRDTKRMEEAASLELSFEFLLNKDEMRWIKLISPQAVLISLSLQGMVHRLLGSKQGMPKKLEDRVRKRSLTYMMRNGNSCRITLNNSGESNGDSSSPLGELSLKSLTARLSDFAFRDSGRDHSSEHSNDLSNVVENNAFAISGDENL